MLINIPVDQITDNPYQRRQDYGDVAGLAADIQANGLLQPPLGRLTYDNGEPLTSYDLTLALSVIQDVGFHDDLRVQLAFGHRRLRAYRHMQTVDGPADTSQTLIMPVEIRPLTDDQMLDYVWSENQHRSDINPIEQAELLAEKLDRARAAGGNQQTVADTWGLDRSTIANKLRLLDLPPEVQQAVRARQLSERQALALLPVLDLEQKLNGAAAVHWGSNPKQGWGPPLSPTAYVAHVVENPDQATSDAIRSYTKSAADHVGNPLPSALAAFEAGEGLSIVQSACKGCPRRHNQHCLLRSCFDARAQRFLAALPEWASRETGLPYSDEPSHFDFNSDEWDAIEADWKAGLSGTPAAHDTLVVTVRGGYFPFRPYTNNYIGSDGVIDDWKAAIVIGRRTLTAAESAAQPATDAGPAPLRPSADELKRWKALAAKGDRERVKHTQQALLREIRDLAENEPAMRALMAMLDAQWLKVADEAHRIPSADEFAGHLLEQAWKRAVTWHYSSTNRDTMRAILHRAAISPDIVDSPDPALRLLDIGQEALLDYEAKRNHVDKDALYKRLESVRAALAEFDAVPHVVAGHGELEQLAAYLRAAVDREEHLLAAETPKEN